MSHEPSYGRTKHGLPVHLRTLDHLPVHNTYARFNKILAVKITGCVGSMTCASIFCLLALASLPAVLTQAFHLHAFPSWLISVGLIALVAWIAQTFLQLCSCRSSWSAPTCSRSQRREGGEDLEGADVLLDRLDEETEGGIRTILDAVNAPHRPVRPADAGRPHGEQPHRSPGQAASDSRAGGTAPAGQAEPGATQGRRRMSIVMYDAIDLSQIPAVPPPQPGT